MLTNVWVRSVAVLGLVFYPVVASATTETFMGTFDLTPAEATFLVTNTNGTASMPAAGNSGPTTDSTTQPPHLPLTFELFNPSLGTLNSVTISFTSSPSATTLSISATNKEDDVIDFINTGSLAMQLAGMGLGTQQQTFSPKIDCTPQLGSGPFFVPCSSTSSNVAGPAFDKTVTLSGSPASAFIGNGMFDLTASLTSSLAPSISPDNGTHFADNSTFNGSLDGEWSGSVSVEYDYTPSTTAAAAPLTLYLLVGGLGGIAFLRRRRG